METFRSISEIYSFRNPRWHSFGELPCLGGKAEAAKEDHSESSAGNLGVPNVIKELV